MGYRFLFTIIFPLQHSKNALYGWKVCFDIDYQQIIMDHSVMLLQTCDSACDKYKMKIITGKGSQDVSFIHRDFTDPWSNSYNNSVAGMFKEV